ncbi:MAG TPA: SRPBCC domain-containing protein [Acidimicrobiia bacterium]|nr:SRPBCC domain-containing protein [Acidimicrobiia bacterium]
MSGDYTLTVRREIAAPAEVLFDAWLDAESLGAWLKPDGIRETRAQTDPREGGSFRIVMVQDETELLHSGTYREIDRPHRLVFTWSSHATRFRDSLVTVTFEPSSEGSTVVEIHQVGLPDEEARASHHRGWSEILRALDGSFRSDS